MPGITVALFGMGRWGSNHFRILQKEHILKYVVNRTAGRFTEDLKLLYPDVRFTTEVDTVLGDDEVQAVFIVTPTRTHYDLAVAALAAGKHVFIEKPFCETAAQADALVRLAKQHDRVMMAGHVFLYTAACRELRQAADISPLRQADLRWEKYGTFDEAVTRTLLPHELFIVLSLFNRPPRSVRLREADRPLVRGRVDRLVTQLEFDQAAEARILVDRTCREKRKTGHYHFRDGRTFIWENDTLRQDATVCVSGNTIEPLKAMIDDFVARICADSVLSYTEDLGCQVVEIMEALEKQIEGKA